MSRRASLFAKSHPGKPRVRFPDELVFLDSIKENDIKEIKTMLRRASLKVNLNAINSAGLTPLHQAVLDGNLSAVQVLIEHGSDINCQDEDSWTPLHAACADGQSEIVSYLLENGADRTILTEDGERPVDLVDPTDLATISIMLSGQQGTGSFESDEEDEDDDDENNNRSRNKAKAENDQGEDDENENNEDESDEDESDVEIPSKFRNLKVLDKMVCKEESDDGASSSDYEDYGDFGD